VTYPTVYSYLNIAAINAIVGSRIYGFAEAPQSPTYPYITWEIISGRPSNYQGSAPAVDNYRVEINVWTRDQQNALDAITEIQSALDAHGHQLVQIGPSVDPDTQSYRAQLDYSLWTSR